MVPAAGVEPARVISPTDFESASSANSNTPAFTVVLFKHIENYNLNAQKNQVFFNKITVHNLLKIMKFIPNVLNRQKYCLCRLLY